MMQYEKLLERAKSKLPESALETARFEMPKAKGHIQGNRTIISNFYQIADTMRREPEHLLKYVLKELATPGELKKAAVIIGTKVSASRINEKLQQYAKEFVLCSECKKPDTKLVREDKFLFLKCSACGARHPVKVRI
ncbi:translation initiation factor IF-2 subunit beta [Candidatus Woesearchaeota archaeon]|nr:translation initiation factor IF-2 subunit beta [Candidatus Woesearchaeota archaeon]